MLDASHRQPSFILTLKLDDPSFAILQEWRNRHFPSRLNRIRAHLTLLHTSTAKQVCRLQASWRIFERLGPIRLKYAAPLFLGHGVAISVDSVELHSLRAQLLEEMSGNLTRQDQQPFRPHVTIQNKAGAVEAKALYASMCSCFEPWRGLGTAVLIWQYLDGPWAPRSQLDFNGVHAQVRA